MNSLYAGLTVLDIGVLLDAKAKGGNWVANDADGLTYWYSDKPVKLPNYVGRWNNPTGEYGRVKHDLDIRYSEPTNIDAAISQIKILRKHDGGWDDEIIDIFIE